jgi:hypothetical protein
MDAAPRDGTFVMLHRSNGTTYRARWTKMPHTIFRDPTQFYWVNDNGKFAEVPFAQAIGWSVSDEQ